MIRIRDAKGAKDRYVMLSSIALQQLRDYYKFFESSDWLFPGGEGREDHYITERTVQRVFQRAI